MAVYPEREAFFAHRAVRLFFKACAAYDTGHIGALLVVHVAHTEDAARYRGPIRFWNAQLENQLQISSGQLKRARRKAVAAGWLHYERDSNRTVGRYWVTVPADVEAMLDDSPVEPVGEIESIVDRDPVRESPPDQGEAVEVLPPDQGILFDTNRVADEPNSDRIATDKAPDYRPNNDRYSNPSPVPDPNVCATSENETNGDGSAKATAFELFWTVVPRKVGKAKARKSFARAVRTIREDRGISATAAADFLRERMAAFGRSAKAAGEFCPYPETWLNQGRWDDDPREWDDDRGGRRRQVAAAQVAPVEVERRRLLAQVMKLRKAGQIAEADAVAGELDRLDQGRNMPKRLTDAGKGSK